MHPRVAQGAPTHPAGLGKVTEKVRFKVAKVCCIASSPARCPLLPSRILVWIAEPEPAPEPEPALEPEPEAEGEISAESGDYAAQFQAKFFGA